MRGDYDEGMSRICLRWPLIAWVTWQSHKPRRKSQGT